MTGESEAPPQTAEELDEQLAQWWQGDVITKFTPVWLADLSNALTEEAATGEGDPDEISVIVRQEAPAAVITQTCDIRKPATSRPYVQLAPVVDLSARPATLAEAAGRHSPQWAPVPGYGATMYADLDLVTTIEKSVLVNLDGEHIRGCRDDDEQRSFALAVARNVGRFAFPDAFVNSVADMQDRFRKKRKKQSAESACLTMVQEIRVRCDDGFQSEPLEADLVFLIDDPLVELDAPPSDVDADVQDFLNSQQGHKIHDVAQMLTSDVVGTENRWALWARLAELWAQACAPVDGVRVEGTVENVREYPLTRSWKEPKLDVDNLSMSDGGSPADQAGVQ